MQLVRPCACFACGALRGLPGCVCKGDEQTTALGNVMCSSERRVLRLCIHLCSRC